MELNEDRTCSTMRVHSTTLPLVCPMVAVTSAGVGPLSRDSDMEIPSVVALAESLGLSSISMGSENRTLATPPDCTWTLILFLNQADTAADVFPHAIPVTV